MTMPAFAGTFRAMGCTFRVCVAAYSPGQAQLALKTAQGMAEELEAVLSRFREDSELVQLNRAGGGPVGPALWQAVRWALRCAETTGGLYDPTVLDRVEAAGYTESFPRLRPGPLPPSDPTVFGRWRKVKVHPLRPLVWLPPGVRLDLGGVGKAFAAEQIASRLRTFGPCLVDAGGDLAVRGVPAGWPGWPVAVEGIQGITGSLWLDRGGLATSGTTVRRWQAAGQEAHHIIDPRTGLPATGQVATATVWASNAVEANAHALALVGAGLQGAAAYLARHPRLRALLVARDGTVHNFGLPVQLPSGQADVAGGSE